MVVEVIGKVIAVIVIAPFLALMAMMFYRLWCACLILIFGGELF